MWHISVHCLIKPFNALCCLCPLLLDRVCYVLLTLVQVWQNCLSLFSSHLLSIDHACCVMNVYCLCKTSEGIMVMYSYTWLISQSHRYPRTNKQVKENGTQKKDIISCATCSQCDLLSLLSPCPRPCHNVFVNEAYHFNQPNFEWMHSPQKLPQREIFHSGLKWGNRLKVMHE